MSPVSETPLITHTVTLFNCQGQSARAYICKTFAFLCSVAIATKNVQPAPPPHILQPFTPYTPPHIYTPPPTTSTPSLFTHSTPSLFTHLQLPHSLQTTPSLLTHLHTSPPLIPIQGHCQGCQVGKTSYIGKSTDAEAAYGSEENPANSCWDLALESQEMKISK